MKFRKGARKELRQLKKQKKNAQSVRYLQWQRNGHAEGGRIQKSKGSVNMRGINGQMNRIFTQLDIYERQEPKKRDAATNNEDDDAQSDDSDVDLGDRLERAYRDNGTKKEVEVKESGGDRIARLRQENEAEDREIAKLEKLLYLNKRKNNNMPQSFVDEGLDFLMELVDKKYKKKYNDDMELLEEQGELTNALTGNDVEDAVGEEQDEDSSADEITQQNEQRRKIRFDDQQSEDSDQFDEMEVDEDDEEMDEEDDLAEDSEEEGDFEGEDLSDEDSVEDDASDCSDEGETEEVMTKLKARSNAKVLKKMTEQGKQESGLESSEKGVGKNNKRTKNEDANDIMKQLKAMREAKKGVNADNKSNKKKQLSSETATEEDQFDDSEDFDDEASDEDGSGAGDEESDYSEESAEANGRSDESDDDNIAADGFIRKKNNVAEDGTYEDIYGRKRNADGEVLDTNHQKYIPPAKRLAMGGNSGSNKIELEKLQKQVKGQLNRLSETNLRPIATLFAELYSRHSKNNVTSTLSLAIGEAVFGLVQTPERLVLEPALLCALLHANEGHEVGAQILEDLVDRLKSLLEDEDERVKGKQLENVIRFLCYLFLFKVVSHGIIYGVLNKLDPTNENDIELILVVLRTCGFALRKCDPLALKELIISLQTRSHNSSSSTRHRFMLETLSALKNNNISKISNCDPSLSDRALKSLRACLNKGAVLQELNVSLDDLYDARVKGKWWLVGSAWTKEASNAKTDLTKSGTGQTGHTDEFSEKIVELARKAGMNTDIRRSIFCIIMSAEDYLDASERILRLNLTHVQQREFCYVLLLCAGNEKRFNPYYAHLALFFCNKNKKVFSMTLQCAIWDAIKAIGSYSERKVSNLARFTALLVQRGGLPLAVLKNIEFVDLSNDKVIQFLRVLLLDVLINMKSENVLALFSKIALAGPKLQLLKEGLGVFLKRFLLRNVKLNDVQTKTVKQNMKAAEEGLNSQMEKTEVDIFE